MRDWQKDFIQFTTSVAFNLTLTKNQCDVLHIIAVGADYTNWKSDKGTNTLVPTVSALRRRGLVEHNPEVHTLKEWHLRVNWVYRLTPAGEHVHSLLEYSGILLELGKSSRSTDLFNQITAIFRDKPSEYKVDEIIKLTGGEYKAVCNVLDYLYRRKRITRVRRGTYSAKSSSDY